MSRNLIKPFFPRPSADYDQQYMASLVQSFALYLEQMQNPGEGRNTFSVFTNLQTDDSGLEPGAIFNHDGYVRVPLTQSPHVRGSQATGSVGTVTVSTS